jgi:hypothetical protein
LAFPRRSYLEGRHAGFGERLKHIRAEMRNRGVDPALVLPPVAAADRR